MTIQPPSRPKSGDYTTHRGNDNAVERADARFIMRLQGCQSVRYESRPDGTLVVHGYLAPVYGENVEQTGDRS